MATWRSKTKMNTTDLWEELGSLAEDELFQAVTLLFSRYEEQLGQETTAAAARHFFAQLAAVVAQSKNCNANRR